MRSYDGTGMQLGYLAVNRVVRCYFECRLPVVLIIMTVGASHRYHNFNNGNINSSHYFMATRFDHITVVLGPNIRAKMYVY